MELLTVLAFYTFLQSAAKPLFFVCLPHIHKGQRMKSSNEISKEIQALQARVEAIMTVAKEENRDLNSEETVEVDSIVGTSDHQGKIAALSAQRDRQVRIEATASTIMKGIESKEAKGDSDDILANVRVPAKAKRAFNSKAFGDEREAYAAGQWLLATLGKNTRAKSWCVDHGIMNAHSEGINTAGGFLVPEFYETSIIRIVEEFGVFRRNGYVYSMGSDVVKVPRRSAGFTVYYTSENAAITTSDMSFTQVQLVAKKPSILTQVSSELNEDEVVGLASLLTQEFGYALAVAEDQAGFNGDGTSTYGGIVGLKNILAAGSIYDAASGNTAFSTLDLADFNKAKGKLPAFAGARNKWYISRQGFAQSMELLATATGGATAMTLAEGLKPMFLGDPVEFVQVLPTTSAAQVSTIVAYYGDLALATTMGVRRAMRIDTDSSVYFAQDAIGVRCTSRYDIVCHSPGDASNAGPIVALKMASS